MSDPVHHPLPASAAPVAPGAHRVDPHSAHGTHDAHADDHGRPEPLGPIDWRAWLAGAIGVGAGLLVVAALLLRPTG